MNELRAGGQTTPIAAGDCASEGHFRMEMQGITRGETKWEDGCRLVKRKRQKTSARGSGRRVRDGILIAREDEEGSSCCLLEIIAIQRQSTPRKQKIGGNHKFVVLLRVLGVEGGDNVESNRTLPGLLNALSGAAVTERGVHTTETLPSRSASSPSV